MSAVLQGGVAAVSCNDVYSFSKPNRERIVLVPGLGVLGDIHAGVTVRHRSRVAADPSQPNLRQVHLIQSELFGEVGAKGYEVPDGGLGENVTTVGLDLLGLPCGTVLRFGLNAPVRQTVEPGSALDVLAAARRAVLDDEIADTVAVMGEAITAELERSDGDARPAVVITGLRNPCAQINRFRPGLLKEVLGRDEQGGVVRKAGVMAVVLRGGEIRPGDVVVAEVPARPHRALTKV
ncbi:MOSC domain-containing protein [Winogradskya consettensis]|nr:MOSC domain-containing protein [Actinoplanes consettensis]